MIGRFAANAAMVAIAALPAMQSAAQQSTRPAQWSLAKAPNCTSYSPCGTGTDPKATCLATLQAEVLAHACVVFTGLKNVSFGDSGHDVSCKADAQFVADGSCWWYSASFTDGLAERVFPYCEIQLTSTQTVQKALRLGDFNYVCTTTAPPAPPPPVPPPPPPPPSPPPAPFPPEGCAAGEGGFFACVPATGLGGSAPPVTTPLQNGGAPPIDVPPALPPASPTPGEITMEGGDASWCAGPNAAGNPIFTGTGNKYEREVDLTGPGGLALVRHYNSGLKGWVHNWQMRLRFDGNSVVAVRPDGKVLVFTGAGIGPWGSNATVEERLTRLSSNVDGAPAWQLITTTDSVELYDAGGRMLSLTARGGRSFRFTYSGPLLQSVTDDFGRSLGFGYDASARLITAFAPGGETVLYGYGGNGHLAWVQHADGTSRRYLYENATFPYALTGLVDEAGRRFGSWSYDAMGRAVATEHAGGVQRYSIGYADDGLSALITEPLGAQRQVRHSSVSGRMIFTGANEPCAQCVGDASAAQPDTAGRIVQNDDFNGTPNQFTYELTRNLPVTVIRAAGRAEGKTMSIQWHPGWRLPVLVTETGKVTEYEYDVHGNVLAEAVRDTATGETRIRRWSYTASMLLASATEADGAVWTFGYDASGNRTSTTNPMGQVTKFTYDAAGRATGRTDPGGLLTAMAYDARGRLVQVDTGGEITAFSYNATGQVSSATLPNGLQMLYGYDAAQRLMMVSDNRGQATAYTLDAMGNPVHQEVRDANGNLAWAAGRVIDSLNRVTSLEDAFGQSTRYVYDGNGAPVASTDPVNRTTRQVRDALGRVTATVFPDSASAAQSWDALDGIAAVTDPKGVATRYRTNSFGEAVAETSPDTGGMTWERDINGNVVSEIDAKGSTAIVERDALGRPARVQYSDHTRSFQYDAAGRVSSVADNSGSTSYIRDALGRVISKTQLVAYSDPPGVFKVAYEWHQGDLAGVDYPSGLKVVYRRSAGRVTQIDVQPAPNRSGKPQPIGAFLTSLAYTALGQPQAWRWASGDAARRNFDINGRMTASELGRYGFDATGHITLVSQNLWARKTVGTSTELYQLPLTWTAAYDARGRLTSFWRPGAASAYNYDANGNRLTGVETSTGDSDLEGMVDQPGIALETAQTARIDPASNRLVGFTQTMTASREGVTVSSVSSQVNYAVDANGAMTSDGLRTFEYDAARRLAKVKAFRNGEGADIEYLHNAMNQRVFKSQLTPQQLAKGEERLDQGFINWLQQALGWFFSGGKGSGSRSMLGVSFVHDEEGHMLGEYDNGTAGNAGRTEYIWLPSEAGEYPTLVGLYKNGKFYQVHTDHLGSPRLVTDGDNAPVWQWPYSAFGNNKPIGVLQVTETSTGAAAFKATKPPVEQNLRYPGQYDDSEFQLVDNWNRTYLRSQGRYGQPDPTGLAAGLNRFIYAGSNPLASIDPMGLDVTVYTYPGQNGNPGGHMAIGVNANPIVGFDPVPSASVWSTILGKDVPGTIDAIRLGRKPEDYVTIYTTPAQDRAIQNYLLLKSQTPGIYNIKAANCATTVRDALNAGNISSLQTMWPRDLMKNLKRIANP